MSADPAVIAALKAAVAADPESVPLLLHLARLLWESEAEADALEIYSGILAKQPVHLEALEGAAECAEALGDETRAHGYRAILDALGGRGTPPAPTPPEPPPPPPALDASGRPGLRVIDGGDEGADADGSDDADVERPSVTLKDVGGLEEVKRRLEIAFLAPLRNPELRRMYGKSLRGGLLLYGPPGCGKTFLARATAGELGARFISVGLSDVLDMWLGESERHVKEIFDQARRSAPTVLFFDEIDALGHKRSNLKGHGGRNVVNALLAQLDGVGSDNEGLFLLAATNHPWDVDAALRRPGRLDRTLLVLPPDTPARASIVRRHLEDRPTEDIDVDWIASKTEEFSGADLAHLCDSAAELALEDAVKTGNARPMRKDDFKRALKEVKPSVRAWFDVAKNFAMFSNDGGAYDELLAYIRARKY